MKLFLPVEYIKNNKKIIDYSLPFPQNLTIYFDLIKESFDKIDKKIQENISKINKLNKTIFNYLNPEYFLCKMNKTNYYVSRAYLDGEIKSNQLVYVYCFIDKTEIFPIDKNLLQQLDDIKQKLKQYSFLQNKSGIYILQLENNKFYIGSSHNIFRRLIQHWTNCGSKWTFIHKPIRLITWILTNDNELLYMENLITKAYVSKYSLLNVRGGNFYI